MYDLQYFEALFLLNISAGQLHRRYCPPMPKKALTARIMRVHKSCRGFIERERANAIILDRRIFMKNLAGILGLKTQRAQRARLKLDMPGIAIYAIGDVHGCIDQLLALEAKIVADARAIQGTKLIVMLGDYIDRGPTSAQVLDHLLEAPPPDFERICLAGNHEIAMLDYIDDRIGLPDWLRMGAAPTLESYGIDAARLGAMYPTGDGADQMIRKTIPAAHIAFLRSLPIMLETPKAIFVHAGIRPGVELAKQSDADLVYIRSEFFENAHLLDRHVVHGHTPVSQPLREGKRLNIDTGAFSTGRLSAVRLWNNKGRFLST
jgi:serine/threonine protein phosphatase 1